MIKMKPMLEKNEIYYCEECKNIVESLWEGKKKIICCTKPMVKLVANSIDAATEKHVPVIERTGNQVTVKVGENLHPMEGKHYILFLEVVAGQKVYRHNFMEGDGLAEATFTIEEEDIKARAFCNQHGFWQSN